MTISLPHSASSDKNVRPPKPCSLYPRTHRLTSSRPIRAEIIADNVELSIHVLLATMPRSFYGNCRIVFPFRLGCFVVAVSNGFLFLALRYWCLLDFLQSAVFFFVDWYFLFQFRLLRTVAYPKIVLPSGSIGKRIVFRAYSSLYNRIAQKLWCCPFERM